MVILTFSDIGYQPLVDEIISYKNILCRVLEVDPVNQLVTVEPENIHESE
jgi:hypothetical protein